MTGRIEIKGKNTYNAQRSAHGAKPLRMSLLGWASLCFVAAGAIAMPAVAGATEAKPASATAPAIEATETAAKTTAKEPEATNEGDANADVALDDDALLLPLMFNDVPRSMGMASSAFGGGMVTPMSIIEPPPATNNTLPGHTQYLNDWMLGNDYQACGMLGSGCLTIDRANFNYSYLSLILNLPQPPNVLDLDGNQPANHMTLIGSVHSDSYIQFQDSNYVGNNNSASCVIIGLACTWRTNAAQNNQVLIGDGSYANGSNTIVMGTNARHQLPTITAASAGFSGGPDTNYAARLGNSVVIGDNSFGNANRQTILGFGATSTHANSVAIGAGSSTVFGAQANYTAFGLVAPQTSSGELSIGATGATRKLTNVAAGSVGTDAVNLAQLQGALSTAAADPFAVKYNDLGGTPDFANITLQGPAGTTISNLRAGAIVAGSTQAVNGNQIFAISSSVAARLGSGASVAPDGTVTAPNYIIAGTGYNNVGSALTALNGTISGSNAFAVRYDDDGTGNPDHGSVTLAGPAGIGSVLGNLAAGQIAAGSLDAVNGGQVFSVGNAVATLFGGGAGFSAGGSFIAPSYVIGGNTYNSVSDALTALDGNIAGGGAFGVQYDDDGAGNPDYGRVTLRGPAGTGTVLANIAGGQIAAGSLEAVNGGQAFDTGNSAASIFGGGASFAGGLFTLPSYTVQGASYQNIGGAFAAVDASLSNLHNRIDNLGGGGGPADPRIAIDGTGNASVAAGSNGVAIGSGASVGGDHGTAIGGDSHAAGPNDTAIGGNARVDADGSTAVGANSTIAATATNAVAVGESASATASGSVALGQGAVADRANTVSVGTAGAQRQVVNVAAGTQATDAVNVQQLNDGVGRAVETSKQYTDSWGESLRREIGTLDNNVNAGVASAMAVAGLPQSYVPGKSMAAVAASSFEGETGFAVGISTISDDGRWVNKISGNSNSKGDVGVTVGTGFMW